MTKKYILSDEDDLRKRDKLFAEIDQMGIIHIPDGSMQISLLEQKSEQGKLALVITDAPARTGHLRTARRGIPPPLTFVAMESERRQPMTEYINREALPSKRSQQNNVPSDDVFDAGWNACLNAIKKIPKTDVAPVVHGRWIHLVLMPDDVTGHTYGECSHCRSVRIVDNYCPNCGAKMDLEG